NPSATPDILAAILGPVAPTVSPLADPALGGLAATSVAARIEELLVAAGGQLSASQRAIARQLDCHHSSVSAAWDAGARQGRVGARRRRRGVRLQLLVNQEAPAVAAL